MSIYEGMFLVDNRHANRDWQRVVDLVETMVSRHGGRVIRCEKWGERKLAYPIRGNRRGTYLLAYFEADGEAPNAIYGDAQISFSDTFLRALILRVDAAPEEEPKKEAAAEQETPVGEAAAEKPAAPAAEEGAPQPEEAAAPASEEPEAPEEAPAEEAPREEEPESTESSKGESSEGG